jgi:hypothetical protein
MGREYRGIAYHLLQRNCNSFSSDLCQRLTGRPAPLWVNRAANLAVSLHCLLPAGWVPPLQPPIAPEDDLMDGAMGGGRRQVESREKQRLLAGNEGERRGSGGGELPFSVPRAPPPVQAS